MPLPKNHNPVSMHNEYSMLSLPDLLIAREKNHLELMRKQNVIGTAVGLYLIRKNEPYPGRGARDGAAKKQPRTLENSEVRDYSWPCILVLVDNWREEGKLAAEDVIPKSLYLDDGRRVPVCLVSAPRQDDVETEARSVVYPSWRIGGGYPVIADVQGRQHIASIGCLVTDGHTVYALTNRHVTGPDGEAVFARFGGADVRIGASTRNQLRRELFTKVYPGWAGKEIFVNLDIGLIRIDNLSRWTAEVYGVGRLGPMVDLGMDNLSLRLINCPVRAYGCGSGQMRGAIKALFYRYKSVGGFEYVADFLIGGRGGREPFGTHPGDSGTLWLLEGRGPDPMPIAVQWGGQVFQQGDGLKKSSYALATCLSTVCSLLNVDVIRDWNLGVVDYWGEVGHYAIGALACTVTFQGLPGLSRLMSQNIDRVGFNVEDLKQTDKVLKNKAHYTFVPLADVADDVWRNTRISHGDTNNDENNHFADMDQKAQSGRFRGKTLLDICKDPANIDPTVWDEFYQGVPGTNPGALPFRVWQGYNEMVGFLKKADVLSFVCAAGCISHYVGDACQPLHISRLHHGDPDHKTSVSTQVHAIYETQMLNAHSGEIVDGVAAFLAGKKVKSAFKGGFGAAARVIRLMRETVEALPPSDIVDAYNEEATPKARIARLWKDFGKKTIERMGEGCLCMADIWANAWAEGGGESIPQSKLTALDPDALSNLYRRPDFLPSMSLRLMIPLLKGTSDAQPQPAPVPAKRRRTKRPASKKAASAAAG